MLRLITIALVAALGAACGADRAASPTSGCGASITAQCLSGTYALSTINGKALPAFVDSGSEQWSAATLTLKPDGTLAGTVAWKEFSNGSVVDSGNDTFSGTYSVSGATITMRIEDDPPATATLASDGSLSLADGGAVFVWRRQ